MSQILCQNCLPKYCVPRRHRAPPPPEGTPNGRPPLGGGRTKIPGLESQELLLLDPWWDLTWIQFWYHFVSTGWFSDITPRACKNMRIFGTQKNWWCTENSWTFMVLRVFIRHAQLWTNWLWPDHTWPQKWDYTCSYALPMCNHNKPDSQQEKSCKLQSRNLPGAAEDKRRLGLLPKEQLWIPRDCLKSSASFCSLGLKGPFVIMSCNGVNFTAFHFWPTRFLLAQIFESKTKSFTKASRWTSGVAPETHLWERHGHVLTWMNFNSLDWRNFVSSWNLKPWSIPDRLLYFNFGPNVLHYTLVTFGAYMMSTVWEVDRCQEGGGNQVNVWRLRTRKRTDMAHFSNLHYINPIPWPITELEF